MYEKGDQFRTGSRRWLASRNLNCGHHGIIVTRRCATGPVIGMPRSKIRMGRVYLMFSWSMTYTSSPRHHVELGWPAQAVVLGRRGLGVRKVFLPSTPKAGTASRAQSTAIAESTT